jgi:hypothetical protein
MKYARKMVLVDFDKQTSVNKPERELDTTPKPLSGIQNEMNKVLNDDRLSDYEKQNRYLHQLNRFLYFNQVNKTRLEDELMDEIAFRAVKNELAKNETTKKERVKYSSHEHGFESDDSEKVARSYDYEYEKTMLEKGKQGAIPKTPKTHNHSTPKTAEKSGSPYGSPYEVYKKLRNRDIVKPKKKKKSNDSLTWSSFEDFNKTVKQKIK